MAAKSRAASGNAVETNQAPEAAAGHPAPGPGVEAAVHGVQAGGMQGGGGTIYVGPTAPGIGIQNCVYTKIPESAREAIKETPEIGNLFIPVTGYPQANRMLREGRGYIYNAFLKAEEIKIKNAARAGKKGQPGAGGRG